MGVLASLLISLLFVSPVLAEQRILSAFGGVNNNESSAIIDDSQAQDALNVDLTPNGRSVKKRSGYGVYKSLGTGQSVRGGHHFFNTGGADVQLWGSSTSLYGITSDATPVQIVSSATFNSTWDCTDTQGFAYCVNSSRDALIKTDGVTISTWMTSPLGTMITSTPDRLVVSGVSGSGNSLYFSQSNVFNNFTTGINETDPFVEVIGAQGGGITHITWGCQKLLWWKNSSFGYITGDNQFNLGIVTINDTIGTVDNSSAIDPGGTVWFRSQDGHIYSYDCSSLRKESVDITPIAQASSNRIANSWTQTSQTDFESGASTPTANLSFTISPGNVIISSFSGVDTSSTDFSLGVSSNVDYTSVPGSFLLTNEVYDEFSNFNLWYNFASPDYPSRDMAAINSSARNTASGSSSIVQTANTVPLTDNFFVQALINQTNTTQHDAICLTDNSFKGYCVDQSSGGVVPRILESTDVSYSSASTVVCNGASTVSYPAILTMVKSSTGAFSLYVNGSLSCTGNDTTYNAPTRVLMIISDGSGNSNMTNLAVSHSSGTFTSRAFDTGFYSSHIIMDSSWTVSNIVPSFVLQQASSTFGAWSDVVASTGTDAVISKRYVRYISSFSVTPTLTPQTMVKDVTLTARSTGTYLSAVKNAPLIRSWDTFTVNKQDNGGTHTFFMRASTNSFTITSTTPAWTAQTVGALVSVATGTYFQVADTFTITNATQTPTLNDFTVNWFEGVATDKAYSIFFDNAIWWSVAYGSGETSNNRIFKCDLLNDKAWLIYDIGTGGMIQQGQYLYFGSTTTSANTYKFGSGTSDNGTAITAYWKSKDFMGSDPWLENQYTQIDSYYKTNSNQNLSVSYFLNTSTTSTSYIVNLSSNTQSVIRNKKLLPNGKIGGNISVKFGDSTDSSQWELLGFRFLFTPLPYRPTQ